MILLAGGVGIGIGAGFYGIVSFAVVISLVLAKLGNHMESRKMARLEREMNKNEVHL
ncbi:hypothetical protein [Fictibacillus phosphorivorans]|nr:hypothetical protein [Fictibacillus phosphorivorans]